MKPITIVLRTTGAIALGVLAIAAVAGSNSMRDEKADANTAARGERGRYLVHGVGLCIDCHSPRDDKGQHIEELHLMGSPVPFQPTVPMPWTPLAPRLAGLPAGYTEEQMVHFLMTGERPNNLPPPLPPMPPYRMNRDDAQAVVAYLRSMRAEAN